MGVSPKKGHVLGDDLRQVIAPSLKLWYNHSIMKADLKNNGNMSRPETKNNGRSIRNNLDIDALLWASVITLGVGLFAPILTFKKLIFYKSTVSIYSVLVGLIQEKEFLLFVIIFIFSVVFPAAKNIFIALTRYGLGISRRTDRYLRTLGQISKWSMLDVFLVALLVVIMRLGVLGKVEVRWGIYVFAASVILSTLATHRLITKMAISHQEQRQI